MKPSELKEKIEKGEELMLLDVREEDEVRQDRNVIPGSENIPMGMVFTEESKGRLPKRKKIITICKSGRRAGIVADELSRLGYDIESLEGGMDAWEKL